MKKILLTALALVMAINLAACSAETAATLVDITTDQGISMKLPSDMAVQPNKSYSNSITSDVATFGLAQADSVAPLDKWTQDEFVASELDGRKDLKIASYDNNRQINGKPSLVCKFSFTSDKGTAITGALIMIDDAENEYIIKLLYTSDNTSGSLAKNLDACIDSISGKAN